MSADGTSMTPLRRFREMRGLTVRQFAEQLSVSAATVSRIERGHLPDIPTLYHVALAMGFERLAADLRFWFPQLGGHKR